MYIIYTKFDCPKCEELKFFLQGHNIEYEEYNILECQEKLQELRDNGIRSVPVLYDGDKLIGEFQRAKQHIIGL